MDTPMSHAIGSTDDPAAAAQADLPNAEALRRAARAAAANAFAPYSNFRVGAALLLSTGDIVTGSNVENASYGLTSCAERNAVFTAIGMHGPSIRLRAVAVANLNNAASMPCGACRQVLAEFGDADTWVYFPGADGPAAATLGELLPFVFKLSGS